MCLRNEIILQFLSDASVLYGNFFWELFRRCRIHYNPVSVSLRSVACRVRKWLFFIFSGTRRWQSNLVLLDFRLQSARSVRQLLIWRNIESALSANAANRSDGQAVKWKTIRHPPPTPHDFGMFLNLSFSKTCTTCIRYERVSRSLLWTRADQWLARNRRQGPPQTPKV